MTPSHFKPHAVFSALGYLTVAYLTSTNPATAAPQAVKPECKDSRYELAADSSVCTVKAAVKTRLAAIKDKAECEKEATYTETTGAPPTCTLAEKTNPVCPGGPRVQFNAAQKACMVDDSVPATSRSEYTGDCLELTAKIPSLTTTEPYLYVAGQSEDGNELSVQEARSSWLPWRACAPTEAAVKQAVQKVAVTDIAATTLRSGWVWGTLAVPFKFYYKNKALETSPTVAPYFGRRMEYFGGAVSFVVGAGLGLVNGQTEKTTTQTDANGQTTQTVETSVTTLPAFSTTVGLIFEGNKGKTAASGFKSGVVFGKDWVSEKTGSTYFIHQNKPWVSVQIGYQFTDY